MALVVAAMMSASVSASAQGRKGEFAKGKKEFRKEIKCCQCPCCREAKMKKAVLFNARFQDKRFKDARFRDQRFEKGLKFRHHGKKHPRL